MIGIIAGSGFSDIEGCLLMERIEATTPFGSPSGSIRRLGVAGGEVFFLPRHGDTHGIPPHRINYRANIRALKDAGARQVISVSAVGSLREAVRPGTIVLGEQIVDFTRRRETSFFDGEDVVHVDFTNPYCPDMRRILKEAAAGADVPVDEQGQYIAVEGPRLETAAEIRFFGSIGGTIVGMTAMPEAALAREAELCYAGLYVVTNMAAGITGGGLTTDEVVTTMKASMKRVGDILIGALPGLQRERGCTCHDALRDARL